MQMLHDSHARAMRYQVYHMNWKDHLDAWAFCPDLLELQRKVEKRTESPAVSLDQGNGLGDWTYCPCPEQFGSDSTRTTACFTKHELHNEQNDHYEGQVEVCDGFGPTEYHIRATRKNLEMVETILDSGNDVTVLHMLYQHHGKEMGAAPVLRDAQGNRLTGASQRKVELVFKAANQSTTSGHSSRISDCFTAPGRTGTVDSTKGWASNRSVKYAWYARPRSYKRTPGSTSPVYPCTER